jgi:hypothetical protein
VHLRGEAYEIGFQHGALLAAEIADAHRAVALGLTHDSKPYAFYRDAARTVFWPATPIEHRLELEGMAAALASAGVNLDIWDLVVLNASLELPYFVNFLASRAGAVKSAPIAERCSAFAATGSYTRDGRIVAAHNCWSDYLSGSHWNILFDIEPSTGERFFMDGLPGFIHSGDDFAVNAAGLVITETTISGFHGFDPRGVPEFVRARRAMQYARSIDDFAAIMKSGNNGGYANNWLLADNKTGEIASLELGLRHVNLRRTRDGYFAGANFPVDPKLIAEETDFDPADAASSSNARRRRWTQLLEQNRGRIDLAAAQRFLADHHDTVDHRSSPNERTLCGHIETSRRGVRGWTPPYGAAGSVQNKAIDASLASTLSFTAAFGHACGASFHAAPHLKLHPEFAWQNGALRDIEAQPWTLFRARRR